MKKEIAKKAAKWWADQLRGNAKFDNDDDSVQSGMASRMTMMCQAREKKRQTPEQIDAFESNLEEMIMCSGPQTILVDYDPCVLLSDAAEKAGLKLGKSTLPWKTVMWVGVDKEDEVWVECGHGAPRERLD